MNNISYFVLFLEVKNYILTCKRHKKNTNNVLLLVGIAILERISMNQYITRNFGRSLRIPDASLQTSVNFPRTRPLTCMEQSAFLFSINQESTENKKAVKNIVKNIFHYALLMKQKNSGSICRFHGPKTTRP